MKATNLIYWITTGLVAVMMSFSAYMYLTSPEMEKAFQHLGFPAYFRVELAIAKVLGVLGLMVPFKGRLKEWVYAGFTINFISAFIAHTASGDPLSGSVAPLIFLGLLLTSYVMYHKRQKHTTPAATFVALA